MATPEYYHVHATPMNHGNLISDILIKQYSNSFKSISSQLSEQCCDLCHVPDPILLSSACSHVFHSRCVDVWPLQHCPVCEIIIPHVSILHVPMDDPIPMRHGKWTTAEIAFVDNILSEFSCGVLPLANGTPLRLVVARLLNCSTMRVSKKFQKNALGKQTVPVRKQNKGAIALECPRSLHRSNQIAFSRAEEIFRQELINAFDGGSVVLEQLRKAVKQFWVSNFLKFAVVVGQSVQGLDISSGRKKKVVMNMLRQGQYQQFVHPVQAQLPMESLQPNSQPASFSEFRLAWMDECVHSDSTPYEQDLVQDCPRKRHCKWSLKSNQAPNYELALYEDQDNSKADQDSSHYVQESPPNKRPCLVNFGVKCQLTSGPDEHEFHQQQSISELNSTYSMYNYPMPSLCNTISSNEPASVSESAHYHAPLTKEENRLCNNAPHPGNSYPSQLVRPYPEYRGPISSVTMSRSIILDDPWTDFLGDDIADGAPWSPLQIC